MSFSDENTGKPHPFLFESSLKTGKVSNKIHLEGRGKLNGSQGILKMRSN